ncbi:hypothetical protein [Myxococcus xanthus]|uniref:Uncharacterized protein n=1 Tax=Myxococcus xanthus TaxID=34 RepID=A0AAE6KSR9_MYXXA|nr:hypothetical protein [Myxococcus xanthus]QDE68470.1 hypothetical protein BHS09_16570 [Myxococcus xanthus]QDE75747.1 hypothetical protein BHS08_16585 [Myxococcus xanthus]QDE97318.1 hypothetical protein BHS05_16480 [Myxococcus xanthus]QDF04884.1 hypothetical protein BHS04_16975 [Myxococcus xanthus]
MRHWSLALLVSLASPALAQDAAAPAPESAQPPPPEVKAPTPAEPTPEAEPKKTEAPATPPAAEAPAVPAPSEAPAKKASTAAKKSAAAAQPTRAAPTPPPADAPPVDLPPGLADFKRDPIPDAPPLSPEEQIRRDIQADARFLFQSLLTGDVRTASNELLYPFSLEAERYATPEELVSAWVKQLRLKRTDLITLYDVEVMPLEAMEKKYGKAPARLGLDLRNPKDVWTAVGNLSGRPAVLVYRQYRDEFRAFAYTD